MTIQDVLQKKKMSVYRLAKTSEVPYATLNDLYNGKTRLEKCSAETVYKLAKALDVSMEELVADSLTGRRDFELFKSEICHRVRRMGDMDFIIDTLRGREIRTYEERKWYPECLYLLAMLDYISRVNDVPLCSEYDDLRRCRLQNTLYPRGIRVLSAVAGNDDAMKESEREAIPEFMRFNIVESEVRNVV